jgi:hypothetical protein
VSITEEQVGKFCGNVLEVRNDKGEKLLVMGTDAYAALTKPQLDIINKYCTDIIISDIPTIQKCGGGGTRCMMAEIFLSRLLL